MVENNEMIQVFVYDDEEKQVLIDKVNKLTNLTIAEYRPSGKYSITFDKTRKYDSLRVDIQYKKDGFLKLVTEGYDSSIVNKLFAATKIITSIDEINVEEPKLDYRVENWNNNTRTSVEVNIYKEKLKQKGKLN